MLTQEQVDEPEEVLDWFDLEWSLSVMDNINGAYFRNPLTGEVVQIGPVDWSDFDLLEFMKSDANTRAG